MNKLTISIIAPTIALYENTKLSAITRFLLPNISLLMVPIISLLMVLLATTPAAAQINLLSPIEYNPTSALLYHNRASSLFAPLNSSPQPHNSNLNKELAPRANLNLAYTNWLPNSLNTHILQGNGFINLTKKQAITLSYTRAIFQQLTLTDNQGIDFSYFTPSEELIEAGFTQLLTTKLSLSANLKYLTSNLNPQKGSTTFATDLNLYYQSNKIAIGLKLANLGLPIDYGYGNQPLPLYLELGSLFPISLAPKHNLLLSARAAVTNKFTPLLGAGIEYSFNKLLHLRLATNYNTQSNPNSPNSTDHLNSAPPTHLALGAGINLYRFSLNALYFIANRESPINNSLSFGIGYLLK